MKKAIWVAAGILSVALSNPALAKINYTSITGAQMCCESVGPTGHAAQGCSANPGGATCAIIVKNKDAIAMDRTGNQVANPTTSSVGTKGTAKAEISGN